MTRPRFPGHLEIDAELAILDAHAETLLEQPLAAFDRVHGRAFLRLAQRFERAGRQIVLSAPKDSLAAAMDTRDAARART